MDTSEAQHLATDSKSHEEELDLRCCGLQLDFQIQGGQWRYILLPGMKENREIQPSKHPELGRAFLQLFFNCKHPQTTITYEFQNLGFTGILIQFIQVERENKSAG